MRLIQISAWNDSGGGFTHRLFDDHPQLRVWPFELLLGRDRHPVDGFGEDWFRGRFRWARLGDDLATATADDLFDRIADSELKAVLRSPNDAKHAGYGLDVSLDDWRAETRRRWAAAPTRRQADFLAAYIDAFFFSLEKADSGRPVLGHCPVAVIDAPEIWADFPDARILHVVRSPLAGFADMRRRHPSLQPERYAAKWSLVNGAAALWAGKAPDRLKLLGLTDLIVDREATLSEACDWLGLTFSPVLLRPTWRGRPLPETAMGPFGGVPVVSAHNEAELAAGLSDTERAVLRAGCAGVAGLLDALGPGSGLSVPSGDITDGPRMTA